MNSCLPLDIQAVILSFSGSTSTTSTVSKGWAGLFTMANALIYEDLKKRETLMRRIIVDLAKDYNGTERAENKSELLKTAKKEACEILFPAPLQPPRSMSYHALNQFHADNAKLFQPFFDYLLDRFPQLTPVPAQPFEEWLSNEEIREQLKAIPSSREELKAFVAGMPEVPIEAAEIPFHCSLECYFLSSSLRAGKIEKAFAFCSNSVANEYTFPMVLGIWKNFIDLYKKITEQGDQIAQQNLIYCLRAFLQAADLNRFTVLDIEKLAEVLFAKIPDDTLFIRELFLIPSCPLSRTLVYCLKHNKNRRYILDHLDQLSDGTISHFALLLSSEKSERALLIAILHGPLGNRIGVSSLGLILNLTCYSKKIEPNDPRALLLKSPQASRISWTDLQRFLEKALFRRKWDVALLLLESPQKSRISENMAKNILEYAFRKYPCGYELKPESCHKCKSILDKIHYGCVIL